MCNIYFIKPQKNRDQLIDNGVIKKINKTMRLAEDYIFSSPSTAACLDIGSNANILTEWRLEDNTTLKDFETFKK